MNHNTAYCTGLLWKFSIPWMSGDRTREAPNECLAHNKHWKMLWYSRSWKTAWRQYWVRGLRDREDSDTQRRREKHFKIEKPRCMYIYSIWRSLDYTKDKLENKSIKDEERRLVGNTFRREACGYTMESLECQAEKFGLWPIANEVLLSFMN